ncbi:MAG: hypothetical protein QXH02_07575 [Desulfurococcaceae archaeon]
MKITIVLDLARYPHISLERDYALRFIEVIMRKHGSTRDLEEAKRIILGFDEYYSIAHKKSNGYLVVIKDPADSLRGRVIVHKVKLLTEHGKKIVELILDRRAPRELIISSLEELGFTEVEFTSI